jgi:hypothetical protein
VDHLSETIHIRSYLAIFVGIAVLILRKSKRDLDCAPAEKKELRQQEEELKAGEHDRQENPAAPNVNMMNYDACKRKVAFGKN